jgi:AraC-like DNA-binding protein
VASVVTPELALHGLPGLHQQLMPRQVLGRHRHAEPYAALVLDGHYLEAGDQGRRRLEAGDVVLHDAFSAHANQVGARGARLINLPWRGGDERFARLHDPDAVLRLAARDPPAAAQALQGGLQPLTAALTDWPDLLARDMTADPGLSLTAWARRHGLAAETLSRGFVRVFGITPRRWRFEVRTRRALAALRDGAPSLVGVALDAGFADQAHLTHAVVALTGRPPGHWRRASSRDKTAARGARTIG